VGEDSFDVLQVVVGVFGKNKDIVNVNDYVVIAFSPEDVIHQGLEGSGGVAEAVRQYDEFEVTVAGVEGSFGNILRRDADLVVRSTEIDFGEDGSTSHAIKEIIHARQRSSVLDGELVESAVVDAHTERTAFLFNENDGGAKGRGRGADVATFLELGELAFKLCQLGDRLSVRRLVGRV
jgi:hypothetical protein